MLLYVNPVSATLRTSDPAALAGAKRQVALEELEHFFAFTLLKEMRKTVPDGGLFKKSQAQEMQEEMLDDALSGAMAKAGQLGVARMVDQQLRIAEMQGKWRADIEARRAETRRGAAVAAEVATDTGFKIQRTFADEGIGSIGGAR